MDMFDLKNVEPMLITDNRPAFNSPDWLYELKLDGIRCIAFFSPDGTELRNKRNKRVNPIYPELLGIHKQVCKRCILDGEVLVLKDGKPYFSELQRRSLMSNAFKISLAAQKLPVCFTAFDILYLDDKEVTNLPLIERKALLSSTVSETPRLAISRYIEEKGIDLYTAAEAAGLEGIVAKRKDSRYYIGKRTKDWIKCKVLLDDDFIVCGYYYKEDRASIILGTYQGEHIIYQSHVVLGISRGDFKIISSQKQVSKNAYYGEFTDYTGAIWLEPKLVCTVRFMERMTNGGLRQPIFKGLRNDKVPKDCVL